MEHLTQFEVVFIIVCAVVLFIGIVKFIARFGFDLEE